ncbi:hypothetical protein GDO78_005046 [Eleutherodactylus coqui]|uniref:Uncharacterized protein n=1 Tax=Eleutherodactylus coqui TaxID=57060 RepID=A0A8J6KEK8_ELECQ|nr:hypothetical protein GDO78_005046 [Eleutherodactylus coqui]
MCSESQNNLLTHKILISRILRSPAIADIASSGHLWFVDRETDHLFYRKKWQRRLVLASKSDGQELRSVCKLAPGHQLTSGLYSVYQGWTAAKNSRKTKG